ncbi:glycosyltransferase involved in cell wall biosynthesis [Nicoletella semolina]|uniref:Glycosyltransferase involved in cell wall biosynthesis n=1 Tax=Nicoletella semolina TaxID=271160 RepID=A0A4R2N7K3_9PAST|nr:glycosyltransferase [Nicoletella semolina]MDH2924382.1 hypothetical protein [Nicoletella semolina]TCP16838.1 glycosyltransferase involved in cell wall biosynthesis [Nicoletella semolina]
MKVLFLHKSLIMGGVERILVNYLNLLKDESHLEIHLLLDNKPQDDIFSSHIPHNIKTTYFFDNAYLTYRNKLYIERKLSIQKRLKYKWLNFKEKRYRRKQLLSIISKNNYDIVINFSEHFHRFLDFNKIDCPIVRWQHGALSIDDKIKFQTQIHSLNKYDYIVAICQEMAEQILENNEISKEKVKLIYNPINYKNLYALAENHSITDSHLIEQASNNEPFLLQVSRLDPRKRHEWLIQAYAKLVKKGIKEKLYIIGGGEIYKELYDLIKSLNLEEYCFLLGQLNNPYPYMKNAKLFLHTSETEGFCTVLVESLAFNVPVVAMNCPTGTKEILNNGKCGALTPLGDIDKFVEEIYHLLTSENRLNDCRQEIIKHISSFGEDKIKYDFLTLLDSIHNQS